MTLYEALQYLQTYLVRILGACPTCHTRFPGHYRRDD
jgi:hypothetical protein